MVIARDQDRDAQALTPPADLPVHLKAPGDVRREVLREARAVGLLIEEELGAQEEPTAGRV